MDMQTLAAAVAISKHSADSSAGRAEAAARLAEEYGYSLTFEDGYMVIGEAESEE